MEVKLNFIKSTDSCPTKEQGGNKFLLCWAEWQYSLAIWVADSDDFYVDGRYLNDWTNPFVWAELPKSIQS